MRVTTIALAFCAIGLGATLASALEPDKAGEEARDSLNALMKQQRDRAAEPAKPDQPVAAPASKTPDRKATKSIGDRVPTICEGC